MKTRTKSQNKHTIIQKSDKGNSIVIVDRDKYIETIENFLSGQNKFQKIALKDDNFLNFITSQGKRSDKFYKKLVDYNSMSEKTGKHLKPVGTRSVVLYGSCQVNKRCVDAVHLSDQFYLLHKHIQACKVFSFHVRAINQ